MRGNPVRNILLVIAILITILSAMAMGALSAYALGVAPASLEIIHQERAIVIPLQIHRSAGDSSSISISVEGELAPYIELPREVMFHGSSTQASIEANIKLPGSAEKTLGPGPHEARILVREKPGSAGQITAGIAVVSKLTLFIPYPGRYLRLNLRGPDHLEEGDDSLFLLEIENMGTEEVQALAKLQVMDRKSAIGDIFLPLPDEMRSVLQGESVFFRFPWQAQLSPGNYTAEAEVSYGEKISQATHRFLVGRQKLIIVNATPGVLIPAEQAEVKVTLRNEWNQKMNEGYATVELMREGRAYAESPTLIQQYGDYQERTLSAYMDIAGLPLGEYSLLITSHYPGGQESVTYETYLGRNSFTIGYTAAEKRNMILLRILALIAAIFIIFRGFTRNKE